MSVVSTNLLLEAGVHFGHQTKRWNPKMKEYIFTSRDDIYIIDLQKTAKKIDEAYEAMKAIAANDGKVLFVGTRKQASEAIHDEAVRSNSYYVTERWLGGTLTNFRTIRNRVRRLEQIEEMEKNGTFEILPKKEVIKLKKEYDKLNKLLCGIREMNKLPNALFIVDPSKEFNAINEARKLNIPVFGIVDTNCDPDMVDYVIPANDDAIRAVKLIVSIFANAICEAQGLEVVEFTVPSKEEAEKDAKEAMEESLRSDRELNNANRKFKREKKNFKPAKEVKKEDKKEVKKEETKAKVEVKEEVKAVKETKEEKATESLESKTVGELREMAKEKEIKGYSTMKKSELIDALK